MSTGATLLLMLAVQAMGATVPAAASTVGTAGAHHVPRVPNRCDFVLSKGAPVAPGILLPGPLRFYDSWNFTVPEQDEGAALAPGQKVWVSDVSTHGLTCVATATQAGWMPSSQVTKTASNARRWMQPSDFVGTWRRGKYTKIVIVPTDNGGLSVKTAKADCDPAGLRVMICSQYLRAKDMAGTRLRGDMWDFKATRRAPEDPAFRKAGLKSWPCEIHARRIGQALYVDQIGLFFSLCGAQGNFGGTYHRMEGP